MIERLDEGRNSAFGFKVMGKLTSDDIAAISQQIEEFVALHKKPFGMLVDLTAMDGASWAARWEETRFLHRFTDHIARLAVVNDEEWQGVSEMVLLTAASLQAQTHYFHSSEIIHAWHWVKMARTDDSMPTRVMYSGKGLFHDYTPEYMV